MKQRCARLMGLLSILTLFVATAWDAPGAFPAPGPIRSSARQPSVRYDAAVYPPQRVKFEHISIEQGLSQNSVNCILRDSKGFMWFGTDDGLNKYDGYDVAVYRHNPQDSHSLSHDTITSIIEGRAGELWIGTEGGLNRFDRDTGEFIRYVADADDPYSLSSDHVLSLREDHRGALWVGTERGLERLDRDTGRFTHYRADSDDPHSLPDDNVLSIYEDRSDVLWVGTWRGLSRWNQELGGFINYQPASQEVTQLGHNAVQSIIEDEAGQLWVGTRGSGFYRFGREEEQFHQHLVDPGDVEGFVYNDVSVYEDKAGVLWIGTDGGGLYQFDREQERLIPHRVDPRDDDSLSSNYIRSIYEGQSGVLWIGTWGGGINTFDRNREKFLLYQSDPRDPDSLSQNLVLALCEDRDGVLWVGTDGGGLDRFDRERGVFTHYRHDPEDPYSLSNNYVSAIHRDREGTLWVGTWGGGLNEFDREKGRFIHYQADPYDPTSLKSNVVTAIYQDLSGTLWIGTDEGLERLDRENKRFVHYQIAGRAVRAIHQDRTGMLWIGTEGGLDRLDREEGRIVSYQADPDNPGSLSHNVVNAVYQDQGGTLWIGTQGGLNRFDSATETFEHYGEEEGLPVDVVLGILEDDQGHLWLSTTGGLSKFDPRTETFWSYDVSDGLQGYEFSRARCKSENGEMVFGGINGFNVFHPDQVTINPYVPPIVVTSLKQGGESVDVRQAVDDIRAVTFHWPKNFFEFEFAALSYAQPEQNQYAYKLEGFDESWNYIGTRHFGRYTNLPGGTYVLKVKGSNNDGVWNEEGVSIEVKIVPPFWATWWFRGLAGLVLVVGLVGGYQLRVKSIESRSRQLEMLVEERTAALSQANVRLKREIAERKRAENALAQQAAESAVAAERSRLARDLHDAVTQTLFSASLIAEALPDIWEIDRDEGYELLAEMRRLSRGALAEMRTLLMELRPSALTEARLGDLLRQLAEAAAGREDVSISVREEGDCEVPSEVHVALYRIAQEALNNVVKHARADRVTISLCSSPAGKGDGVRCIDLCVSDDGCGFDPTCIPPDRMGLGIIRERAQTIEARLDIESERDHGTQIRVIWKG